MVEVIKQGELPGDKVFTGTCSRCGCVFSFEAKEAILCPDFRDGDYYRIYCPTVGCHRWVTVNSRNYVKPIPAFLANYKIRKPISNDYD